MGDACAVHQISAMSRPSYQCNRPRSQLESRQEGQCGRTEERGLRAVSTNALGERYARRNPGPASWAGNNAELSPDQVDSFAHADQAEPCRESCGFDVETYAVVGDLQT